jgi:cytochrome b pre-mRNA-processing protein 3
LSFLQRIFGRVDRRATVAPLYHAVVAAGRDPGWYRDGQVADTMDGRFGMLAAVTALVMLRLEEEGETGRAPSVLLAELFIDDMDATLRQIGVGDHVVGKHVGKLMGALGGRLTAFREARAGTGDFAAAVSRNIFHDSPPSEEASRWVAERLGRFGEALEALRLEDLLAGRIPAL